MVIYKILSSAGLLLDIVGVIMLFQYGLPSRIEEALSLALGDIMPETEKKNLFIKRITYVSLSALIIGFILQLAGVLIQ